MAGLRIATNSGREIDLANSELETLSAALRGRLLTHAEPEWEEARRVWNGLIDKRPAIIVRCADTADVAQAIRFARGHDLLLAVRGGGHNVAGRALVDAGLVIDLSELRDISVDPGRRIVRAQGGALLGDVDAATQSHGLAVPLGLVSATGIAGFTLHGGYGWLSRRFGLACDNLLAAEVVTADGQVIRASGEENADLLWGLRGGGGNFGVVTSLEYRAHPVGPMVWWTVVFYPQDQAARLMPRFRDFMAGAPEELGALAVLWSLGHEESIPAEVRGGPVVAFAACYSGTVDDGERVTRPIRLLGEPLLDLSGPMPFVEVQKTFDPDYPNGRFYYWKSLYVPTLGDELIDALARHAATRPSLRTSLDIWFLDGAVQRVGRDEAAFARRESPFLIAIESSWDHPAETAGNLAWTRRVYADLERFSKGEVYLNFPGFAEGGEAFVRRAYGDNFDRLRALKAKYDPENVFHGNFNVTPERAVGRETPAETPAP